MKKIERHEARAPASQVRHRLLYIEDVETNYQVASLRLQRGYEVVRAADDREACALLRNESERFLAVLMDVQLHGSQLDGIDLARIVRGLPIAVPLPAYARNMPRLDLPLVFVTAAAASLDEGRAIEVDADARITKPIDFLALNLVLTRIITQRTAARRTA